MVQIHKEQSAVKVIFICFCIMVLLFFVSLLLGRYKISLEDVISVFYSRLSGTECSLSSMTQSVIIKVRMPRIFAAMLIGG